MPGKQLAGRKAGHSPHAEAPSFQAWRLRPSPVPAIATAGRTMLAGGSATCVLLTRCEAWAPLLAQLSGLLAGDEQARVGRLRQARDRRWRTTSYALHRIALGRVLECDPRQVPLRRDARGCPRLDGVRLATSLSHAGDAVAIAIAHGGPVGVDIEPRSRAGGMGEIAARIVHAGDLDAQPELRERAVQECGLQERARERALLELWVRKEAVLKATGRGMEIEMTAFAAPDCALVRPPGAGAYRVRMLDAGPDWALAVAGTPAHRVDFRMWHPTAPADAHDEVHRDDGSSATPAGHGEAPPCARPAGNVSLGAT